MEAAHSSKSLQRTDYATPYIKPKDHNSYHLWSYWYESNEDVSCLVYLHFHHF